MCKGGAAMTKLLISIGKLLTMYVTLPIIALLLFVLIGAVIHKDESNG